MHSVASIWGSVRIRSARGGERSSIEERRLGTSPRYRVLAILTARNELVLPDQRFRLGDRKGLTKYFEQLPERTAYNSVERGRFGLSEAQFKQIYTDLSQPVGFSTKDATSRELLRRAEQKLSVPIQRIDPATWPSAKPLNTELRELSLGTALAFALRCQGLMLVPEQLPGQSLRIAVQPHDASVEAWPIGWKPAISSRQSAPQLYEKRNIEIQGFTLSQALTALQPALRLPVITDTWILEQHQIDPAKVDVALPKKRTFLQSAVRKLSSQARLSVELRVDELDEPFLWVTRFGKNSPTATK